MSDYFPTEVKLASDFVQAITRLHKQGLPRGSLTGWRSIDPYYTVMPGQWTLVTGIPGHGKSEWLDALLVNLAMQGWQFAIYSPENLPHEVHMAKVMEKYLAKPFGDGPTERIQPSEMPRGMEFLDRHFGFVHVHESMRTVEIIVDACLRHFNAQIDAGRDGPFGIVLDPWNEFEHQREDRESETEYISRTLSWIRNMAREWKNVHVFIVAHPAKLYRENGKLPVPKPYDISGSAHWYNKADNCITVWRDVQSTTNDVEIHIQKVRFKHIGKPGLVTLKYDKVTGRYSDMTVDEYARAYADVD